MRFRTGSESDGFRCTLGSKLNGSPSVLVCRFGLEFLQFVSSDLLHSIEFNRLSVITIGSDLRLSKRGQEFVAWDFLELYDYDKENIVRKFAGLP